jgi:hypothetical protein
MPHPKGRKRSDRYGYKKPRSQKKGAKRKRPKRGGKKIPRVRQRTGGTAGKPIST